MENLVIILIPALQQQSHLVFGAVSWMQIPMPELVSADEITLPGPN